MAYGVDENGNEVYDFLETVVFALEMGSRWGVLRIPHNHGVTVTQWHVEGGRAVGDPGIVNFAPLEEDSPRFAIVGNTFSANSVHELAGWLATAINEAAAKR